MQPAIQCAIQRAIQLHDHRSGGHAPGPGPVRWDARLSRFMVPNENAGVLRFLESPRAEAMGEYALGPGTATCARANALRLEVPSLKAGALGIRDSDAGLAVNRTKQVRQRKWGPPHHAT